MWDYGMHGAGWGWGAWLLMILGTVAFWVAIAWFVRAVVQDRPRRVPRPPSHEPEALRVLDERLARGEITPDEYARIRALLTERR